MSVDAAEMRVRELLAELGTMIAKDPKYPRTNEVRDFVRKHSDVGDFKDLAITLILLAESGVLEEGAS
jgi:hypothetical protein